MNSKIYLTLALLLTPGLMIPAQASLRWTSAPVLTPERIKGADRRTQSAFRPQNFEATSLEDFPSSKQISTAKALDALDDGRFVLKTAGKNEGNYHWISASDKQGLKFASTVHYFSNPGPAPRRMLTQSKAPLEIRPLNLPREHGRYRANESWDFMVLADGKPLPNAEVLFETSNDSSSQLISNTNGIVSVRFPDDFAAFAEKHAHHDMGGHSAHGRTTAQFAISVTHNDRISAFNYRYAEDAFTDKLLWPAYGLAAAGSLITGFFLFGRKAV